MSVGKECANERNKTIKHRSGTCCDVHRRSHSRLNHRNRWPKRVHHSYLVSAAHFEIQELVQSHDIVWLEESAAQVCRG